MLHEKKDKTPTLRGQSDDDLWEELELIRGCWNIYVDDSGNRYPHCPRCTVDVDLEWTYCPNCGYPEYDFDEEEQEAIPPTKAQKSEINWKQSGF